MYPLRKVIAGMEQHTSRALIDKYLSGMANAEEKAVVESWYLKHASGQTDDQAGPDYAALDKEMWPLIEAHTADRRKPFRLWSLLSSAAAVAVIMLGVWVYYTPDQPLASIQTEPTIQEDISPGRNTATLILPGGKKLVLSDAKTGVVIDASKLRYNDGEALPVSSLIDGSLREGFEFPSASPPFLAKGGLWPWVPDSQTPRDLPGRGIALASKGIDEANTMRVNTPRGGTYQIVLPDGSKVWLNAASSIKFPASFKGLKQRTVELSGEAYFMVRKSPDIPFVVISHGQEALVLGTEFNVNSYSDENEVITTLVNGSLKVSGVNGKSALLLPGEESRLRGLSFEKRDADLAQAISWRQGTFYFNKTPFTSMMRQVSRWYNVDVVYKTKEIPNIRFTGEIKRDVTLQTVLAYLKDLGVKLRVEDRTLIIE